MKTKIPKVTKAQLERKVLELEAQLAFRCNKSSQAELDKTAIPKLMASGVLLQLTALGGKELISPVVIRDGLSPETIAALKADMQRSFDRIMK